MIKLKDLIINHEEIMKFWDYKKNNMYDVNDISVGNHNSFFWKCPVCRYEWKTRVGRLLNETKGCPNCKKNKSRIEHASDVGLICEEKELMLEWDYETNNSEGLLPTELSKKSKIIVNWVCTKANHKWRSSIYNRVAHKRNCPYCSNQKILEGYNDLVTIDPNLAKEWDYEKNDKKPTEVGAGTGKKYWWKCEKGHEWQASPSNRHRLGVGCPYCSQSISFPEKAIYYYLKKHISNIIPNYRAAFINNKEIDIFIPNKKIGIEYDGLAFHNKKRDKEKDKICEKNDIRLIHVSEKAGAQINFNDKYIYYNPSNKEDLNKIINYLLNMLLKTEKVDYKIDIKKDLNNIFKIIEKENKTKALFNTNPELEKIWNYEKNYGLNPNMFSKGSKLDVWWKCENNHEWKAAIYNVAKGSRCPFCSGRQVIKGINDLKTLCPDLVQVWNKEKNTSISIQSVKFKSNKKVWWKCPKCNYEWESKICNITRPNSLCPNCRNILVKENKNERHN